MKNERVGGDGRMMIRTSDRGNTDNTINKNTEKIAEKFKKSRGEK